MSEVTKNITLPCCFTFKVCLDCLCLDIPNDLFAFIQPVHWSQYNITCIKIQCSKFKACSDSVMQITDSASGKLQ